MYIKSNLLAIALLFQFLATAQEDTNKVELNIFPNPNSGKFYITVVDEKRYMAQLFNMEGRMVKTLYLYPGLNYIHVQIPNGLYIMKVGEGTTHSQFKISIEQ